MTKQQVMLWYPGQHFEHSLSKPYDIPEGWRVVSTWRRDQGHDLLLLVSDDGTVADEFNALKRVEAR